jgi:hypothetical protein
MSSNREIHPATDEAVRRIATGLRTALRIAGLSNRRCERELGLATGYLTRILAGEVQLRVGIVLDLCRMLDLPPAAFIAALFPTSEISETSARLLRGVGTLHPTTDSSTSSDSTPYGALREIRGAVEKVERYLHATQPPAHE